MMVQGAARPVPKAPPRYPRPAGQNLTVSHESWATAADPTQRTEIYRSTPRLASIRLILIEFRFKEPEYSTIESRVLVFRTLILMVARGGIEPPTRGFSVQD